MGAAGPAAKERPDVLVRAIQYSLKEKAAREALTDAEYRGLDIRVHSEFNLSKMALVLRIAWSDPEGSGRARCIDHLVDDRTTKDLGLLAADVEGILKNLSLRGELFFFKLAKHFPKHVKKVECDGQGNLRVEFVNGQSLSTPESDVESTDFLAKCGMIYDL